MSRSKRATTSSILRNAHLRFLRRKYWLRQAHNYYSLNPMPIYDKNRYAYNWKDIALHVLSACDTGRGTITGDGVIGLLRTDRSAKLSLISAGVPSVIVSLWSVPDDSTSLLMTEFYKNLQQKQDKAAALRNAMLTTMKQHPQPKDWAAFTLIGESE